MSRKTWRAIREERYRKVSKFLMFLGVIPMQTLDEQWGILVYGPERSKFYEKT